MTVDAASNKQARVTVDEIGEIAPIEATPALELVGGCKTTRYGCCPDGKTGKVDEAGSNCTSLPSPVPVPNYDQVLSGNVIIKKVSSDEYTHKITFSKKNIGNVLMYQVWSDSSVEFNNRRIVKQVKATTWVKQAFRKIENGTVPSGCNAISVFNPVICQDGKRYSNSSFAQCAGQTTCQPFSDVFFTPTVVMELDNGKCPYHHISNNYNECRHVFVIKRALVNANGQVVFYVSSNDIGLPSNPTNELKRLKTIPVGTFRRARFDIDNTMYIPDISISGGNKY
jgi:hypothetical protein